MDNIMSLNLKALQDEIRMTLEADVKKIIIKARSGSDDVFEEKADGDSATFADIEIGKLLIEKLLTLIPESIVVEEESFDETIFKKINSNDYIWIVDPIDGTKAFRTKGNNEYCVAIALLYKGKPLLSSVYSPEYEIDGHTGCLFEARDDREGAYLNGRQISLEKIENSQNVKCINHIHTDTELNDMEKKIVSIFQGSESIRAYEGHSTLMHYCLTITDKFAKVFTRRDANIWDVIQAAYIVEKAGGIVMYGNGVNIIPVDYSKLIFKEDGKKLLFPFNIACPIEMKEIILKA